jgi:hypothetical protein
MIEDLHEGLRPATRSDEVSIVVRERELTLALGELPRRRRDALPRSDP